MTHDSAVRTIVDLVPEIEKKGAEAVLLDHAESENMPPAQLAKLGQVFNTLRSLDHIDKQANTEERGTSVTLVDVPDLVSKYVSRTKQEKSAAPFSAMTSTHNPATIDLMSAVRFDAVQEKAASAPEPARLRVTKKELREFAFELQIDARIAMEKVAGELLSKLPVRPDGSRDLSAAVNDARPHCDTDALKRSVSWLKSAAASPLVGTDLDAPMIKRAFAHTGECGKLLVEFNYEFAAHLLMRKMAAVDDKDTGKDTGEPDLAEITAGMTDEEIEAHFNEVVSAHGQNPADYKDGIDAPKPDFVTDGTPKGDEGGEEEAAGATTPPPPPPSGPSRVSKVLSALGAPIRGAGKAVQNAAGAAQGHIDRIASKDRTNKDQMNADTDVEDIRRAIGIRRMIGTDPVLRESDPREVLEIYNAIARTNPEIVGNMPALRLLLREAVSYEGLTLDSQKQLTDIRSNSSKSEMQEADNLKRRYTTSGGGDKPKAK